MSRFILLSAVFMLSSLVLAQGTKEAKEKIDYKHGPDSKEQEGVPRGKVTKMPPWTSKVFADTVRDWWVYVPAQYDGKTPACVMVFQDGEWYQRAKGDFRVPTVFDNLIHQGKMPVTISIFLNPGVVPSKREGGKGRQNRSFEYDTLRDRKSVV